MNATGKTVIAALFLSLLFVAAAPAVQSENGAVSATDASMTLTPEREVVYSNGTFNVSVWIQAHNVSTVQARIGFNQSLFQATNVTLENAGQFDGLYLQPGTGINSTGIDNDKGLVGDIVGFVTPPLNATDSLKIATITFQVIASQGYVSPIHFVQAHSSINDYDMNYTNATLTVNPVDVTIDPAHRLVGNASTTYNVNITPNGNPIRAMSFTPTHDTAFVNITEVTNGGLFPIVLYSSSNNVVTAAHPTGTVTNPGTVAVLHCQPLQSGTSNITLTDVMALGQGTPAPPFPINFVRQGARLEVDTDPPDITFDIGMPQYINGTDTWVDTSTPLHLNATDAHNYTLRYRIWNGTWQEHTATRNVTFDLSASAVEGRTTYYVEYNATDALGNTAATGNQTLYLDDTPPTTTATADPASPDGENGWYVSNVTVNLTATDGDGSGVSRIYYYVGDQFPQPYNGNITLDTDGTHNLTYYSIDNVGNMEEEQQLTLNIDTTPPDIDSTLTGTMGDNGWYTSTVDVSMEATDATSGTAGIWYRIDGGDWTTYSQPFTLSTDGTHTIEYYAHDNAGNNASGEQTLKIDTAAPTASISLSGPKEGAVYTDTVTISLSGSDTGSGVARLKYRVDGGSWSTYTGSSTSFTRTADGAYTVECYAVDTAGNQGSTTSRSFEILKNKEPTAAFSISPDEPTDVDPVTFNASASSDSDGTIASYTWDFGDGNTGTGKTASHTYDDNGTYTVTLTVTDDKGATDTATQQLTVANSPPNAVIQTDPTETAKIEEEITFTSLSSDEDGEIVNYTWDFGDGNISYIENTTHTYDEAKDYTIKLTVTDDDGATDTAQVTLTVEEEQPDYLLPIIAIIVLIVIAIAVVLVWRRRGTSGE